MGIRRILSGFLGKAKVCKCRDCDIKAFTNNSVKLDLTLLDPSGDEEWKNNFKQSFNAFSSSNSCLELPVDNSDLDTFSLESIIDSNLRGVSCLDKINESNSSGDRIGDNVNLEIKGMVEKLTSVFSKENFDYVPSTKIGSVDMLDLNYLPDDSEFWERVEEGRQSSPISNKEKLIPSGEISFISPNVLRNRKKNDDCYCLCGRENLGKIFSDSRLKL